MRKNKHRQETQIKYNKENKTRKRQTKKEKETKNNAHHKR